MSHGRGSGPGEAGRPSAVPPTHGRPWEVAPDVSSCPLQMRKQSGEGPGESKGSRRRGRKKRGNGEGGEGQMDTKETQQSQVWPRPGVARDKVADRAGMGGPGEESGQNGPAWEALGRREKAKSNHRGGGPGRENQPDPPKKAQKGNQDGRGGALPWLLPQLPFLGGGLRPWERGPHGRSWQPPAPASGAPS